MPKVPSRFEIVREPALPGLPREQSKGLVAKATGPTVALRLLHADLHRTG